MKEKKGINGSLKEKRPINSSDRHVIRNYLNSPVCQRCGGLMFGSYYLGEEQLFSRSCVQCGEVIDVLILLNRLGLTLDDDEIYQTISPVESNAPEGAVHLN